MSPEGSEFVDRALSWSKIIQRDFLKSISRFIDGQKEIAKNVYEVDDANYNLENNDSRNVPSRCPLNFVIFPQIIDQTVPYTQLLSTYQVFLILL